MVRSGINKQVENVEIQVIYKIGDYRTSSIFSRKKIRKHHLRIIAYGIIDELNA